MTITVKKLSKVFDNKNILFLINKTFKHIQLIKNLILNKSFHFEKLFSKKTCVHIKLFKLKQDVILKLMNNSLIFKLFKYKRFIKYILFKKETY